MREEKVWPSAVNWDLEFRYDLKRSKAGPWMPYLCNLRNKMLWLTESKAFARSKKIEHVFRFLSKLLSNFSTTSIMVYSVPKCFLNPNWWEDSMLWLSRHDNKTFWLTRKSFCTPKRRNTRNLGTEYADIWRRCEIPISCGYVHYVICYTRDENMRMGYSEIRVIWKCGEEQVGLWAAGGLGSAVSPLAGSRDGAPGS